MSLCHVTSLNMPTQDYIGRFAPPPSHFVTQERDPVWKNRWADLIESTVRQVSLYQQFGWQTPTYIHLPLVLNLQGNKLSKQNHAPTLSQGYPRQVIVEALRF